MTGAALTARVAARTSFSPEPVFNTTTGSSGLTTPCPTAFDQSGISRRARRLGEDTLPAKAGDGLQNFVIAYQDIRSTGLARCTDGTYSIPRQVHRNAVGNGLWQTPG